MPQHLGRGAEGKSFYTLEQAKATLLRHWEDLQEFNKEEAAHPLPSFTGKTTEEMDDDLLVLQQAEEIRKRPYVNAVLDTWRDEIPAEQKPQLIQQLLSEGRLDLLRFIRLCGGFDTLAEEARESVEKALGAKIPE